KALARTAPEVAAAEPRCGGSGSVLGHPQLLRVMHQRLQTKHAFAFGIDLQGYAPADDLEHRQIIRRFLDHDSPAPGRAVFAVKGGPPFAPQESLDALDPQGCTTAVDHRLEYLLHPS